jgi:chemotaxis protein methyltransferase WspC
MHADAIQPVANTPSKACPPAETLLERWIGLDSQTVGSAAIARAVRVRMEACGDPDEETFLARLARDAAEQGRLIDEVVVPESWFFRDQQVFDFLREFAITFATTRRQAPLRILCAPCAAGEEPYSVAMALLEAGLSTPQFCIDAADVSHAAVARAKAATYSANAFRGTDLAFRDRWFRTRGAVAELDETVRNQVHFSRSNLLDESFAADRPPYDIIFCRNLLIYLTSDARCRVEMAFDRLLAPDGLLVLGAAEPPILKGSWLPVAGTAAFTLGRGTRANGLPVPTSMQPPAVTAAPIRGSLGRLRAGAPSAAPAAVHAPRGSAANEPVTPRPPTGDELLRAAHELANAGRRVEAMEACQRHQQAAGPSAQVFFLMGMLYQASGDLERAEASLHKTLYMDPAHDEAFLSLAVVATQRGDAPMAEHYRQSAARIRARKGSS